MLAPLYLSIVGLVGPLLLYQIYSQIVYHLKARKFARLHGCKPPKADRHWDPILGLDFVIKTIHSSRHRYQLEDLQKRFQRIGTTFSTYVLGETLIFTDDPKNVQAVLATHFDDFDVGKLRKQCTWKLMEGSIFVADGALWAHSRAIIRPNFVRKQVADLELMEQYVQKLIGHLPGDGTPINIQEFFSRMTLDTATDFLFGTSVNSLDPNATDASKHFAWAFDYALGCIAQKMRLGKLNWVFQDKKFDEACKYIHEYVQPLIEEAVKFRQAQGYLDSKETIASRSITAAAQKRSRLPDAEKTPLLKTDTIAEEPKEERYVFLYELAKQTGDVQELRDHVINTLIAGRDTTAALMSSTIFTVSRRPDVWAKLQAEIAPLNGQPPTFEQIQDMVYLKRVLKEVLRLYTVVPINAKFANKDTMIPKGGGPDGESPIFIHKGQMVVWNTYAMHRREDLWGKDAAEFRPERWEGLLPGFSYLPFNGGPRICPGQQFALTEASYTLTRVFQSFSKIEVVPEDVHKPWIENLTLTCAVNGVNVKCWK